MPKNSIDRVTALTRLAQHLRYCTTCHESGTTGKLCANGARLWSEAGVKDPPYPMPREWGPGDSPNTDTRWERPPKRPINGSRH